MNILTIFFFIFSFAHAQTFVIQTARMSYEVSHLIKKVGGESKELKGKMECGDVECEFLIGSQVKSFISSDSNRDLNMQTVTESGKFPVTSATGKLKLMKLIKGNTFLHSVEVNFHGVKRVYEAKTEVTDNQHFRSEFMLKLTQHGVERPSLFGVEISDDVPMNLEIHWSKN